MITQVGPQPISALSAAACGSELVERGQKRKFLDKSFVPNIRRVSGSLLDTQGCRPDPGGSVIQGERKPATADQAAGLDHTSKRMDNDNSFAKMEREEKHFRRELARRVEVLAREQAAEVDAEKSSWAKGAKLLLHAEDEDTAGSAASH